MLTGAERAEAAHQCAEAERQRAIELDAHLAAIGQELPRLRET